MNKEQAKNFILDKLKQVSNNRFNEGFKRDLQTLSDAVGMPFSKISNPTNRKNGVCLTSRGALDSHQIKFIESIAASLKPWRKGPFYINDLCIDSEWQSFIKLNTLLKYLRVQGKRVLDIGANNGYYLFELLDFSPTNLCAIEPSNIYKAQFEFIDFFVKSSIEFFQLGIEDLKAFCLGLERVYDVVLCLGVLYHRHDPIVCLKSIASALAPSGELILDSLIIENSEEVCLCPRESYAKMSNVYFIPSIKALENWCERAGFSNFEVLEIAPTTIIEQRRSEWICGESLENFLSPDKTRTIEGYQAPIRGYFRVKR